ncbi:hypothetical protein DN745_06410 [Bradymonas sediminis]|uniref:Uncharacterized protein n=1 Tax=Bradymonas sediminis TaxID=1548548 RepID=A0A2Z4FQT3_9DELT|nr:hypothetical protein DN745_06410 [Bradymonas sediminis]
MLFRGAPTVFCALSDLDR